MSVKYVCNVCGTCFPKNKLFCDGHEGKQIEVKLHDPILIQIVNNNGKKDSIDTINTIVDVAFTLTPINQSLKIDLEVCEVCSEQILKRGIAALFGKLNPKK